MDAPVTIPAAPARPIAEVRALVAALQQALGVKIEKGQIVLNLTASQYQSAEYRICVNGGGRETP